MDLEQLARETAEKMGQLKNYAYILSALNKATKEARQLTAETRQDLLNLLVSTDETVALHSKFTGRYRGI